MILYLEKTKTTQQKEIASLKRRVKKLGKKNRSRTHRLKRLYKVGLMTMVESSYNEESLGEDASIQGRIDVIVADEDITLVSVHDDADKEVFDVYTLDGEEVFVAGKNENVIEDVVDVAQVSTAAITVIITTEEITLAQALEALKNSKTKKEERANIALIETWDDIQRKEESTLQLRAEEKRNKPQTKAQQRKIICTYLKNMEGYKLKDLKLKEFDYIQEMFDKAFKRQNVEDDKETAELKQLMETIPDEEEVVIDAIPLAVKSSRIVDWKIHKEGKKSYYQIVRVDGKSQMYMIFSQMLKSFNMKDLKDLYKLSMQIYMLVEKNYPLTPPTLSMMLEKKLQIDYESEMAYQLCKLIRKELKK
nr:hypothetical protein [Tanacetum cinerariifolium]